MTDDDWQRLVDLAMGSEAEPPQPMRLAYKLNEWEREFERAEGGPALFPDFPEPIQSFFRKIALVSPTRPCKSERVAAAAKRAWIQHVFRDGYEQNLEMAQMAKDLGIPYNGRILMEEKPSEAVIMDIVEKCDFGPDRLSRIINPRK